MNFLKTKKSIAVSVSALILASAAIGGTTAYNIKAIEDNNPVTTGSTDGNKSSDNAVVMWKAELSEYTNKFTLTNYEKVEIDNAEEKTETKKETENSSETENDANETESESNSEETQNESETDSQTADENTDYSLEYTNGATMNEVPERVYTDVSVESGNFGIVTYGYGHGVGLSQNGANHYASYAGWGYQQILSHYFPGTYIQNTGTASNEVISAGGVSGSTLDIISMVVYNEMSDSMNVEAMKAQAVAAYSYIKYKDGAAYDLCPRSNPPETVVNAVRQVLGEALYYDGNYALAMFGASSGGATASCYDIFYEDIPYLRSVPCEYDEQCDPHYGSVVQYSVDEMRSILEGSYGISLSDDVNNWVQVVEGDGGYAASVIIDGQVTVKGNDFKCTLGLKSPKFTCQYYS